MPTEHTQGVIDHKRMVGMYINIFVTEMVRRAIEHDFSKFSDEEAELFEKVTPILKKLTYGSQEYKDYLAMIKPAIDHHYKENSHHPEHYENGVDGMNLMDLVEMFCDWMGAVKRHENGDIQQSIVINQKRFQMNDQLVNIFKNTVDFFENKE